MHKKIVSRMAHYAKTAALIGAAVSLTVAFSVLATTIGTSISTDGTLAVTGASTFTGAATFNGTLQASSTALFTGNVITYGNTTFGDANTDINLFTGTLQASTTALFTGNVTHYANTTFGSSGTAVSSILYGFCDFGPIVASQTIAATSTGTVACTTQAPTGHAAGDRIWLTASTTSSGVVNGSVIYTGIASSTAAGRVQAMIYNGSGASWTVTTSTWQYLIVK